MIIRAEHRGEGKAIAAVVKAAFASAEHADGTECELVEILRNSGAYLPALSLVAETEGLIAGHILFTRAFVGDTAVLALAPLSVLPAYQRQGIGAALIQEGHRIAKELGYGYSVVLGSERYYPKFGYLPAHTYGILPPFDVPQENFMACKLIDTAPAVFGILQYAKEFGIAPPPA